jgi:hypothetical protein
MNPLTLDAVLALQAEGAQILDTRDPDEFGGKADHTSSKSAAVEVCIIPPPTQDDKFMLRINDQAPDFTAETSQGTISFHEWTGNGCGHLVFAPQGLYPGAHHGTGL